MTTVKINPLLRKVLSGIGVWVLALSLAPLATAQGATPKAASCEPSTYALPGERVFPEGIAYDAATNHFYAGSAADGTLFRGTLGQADSVEVFSPAGADGRIGSLGLAVDAKGRLFVAGSRTGQIFVYDTKTSALITSFDTIKATGMTPDPVGFPHNLTDVTIAPNGDVYVTDAFKPFLHRVYEDYGGKLAHEVFLDFTGTPVVYDTPVTFDKIRSMADNVANFNLNGVIASPDGKYLVIAQTNTGKLFRVTVVDKSIASIDLGGEVLRADYLVRHDKYVYVNRINLDDAQLPPTAIAIVEFDEEYTQGKVLSIYTDKLFKFQTALAVAGKCMLAVNAQLDGFLTQQIELPFTVVSIPIPQP